MIKNVFIQAQVFRRQLVKRGLIVSSWRSPSSNVTPECLAHSGDVTRRRKGDIATRIISRLVSGGGHHKGALSTSS